MSDASRMNDLLEKAGLEPTAVSGGLAHPAILRLFENLLDRIIALEQKTEEKEPKK